MGRSRGKRLVRELPDKIVLASSNVGKLREIVRVLGNLATSVVPQSDFNVDDAIESGATFVDNALIKARHAVEATGLAAIADDSGLAVDALDGRPGVHSARYAGPQANDESNIDKLLRELDGVADDDRGAAFHCAVCFLRPDGSDPLVTTGEWRGTILRVRRGDGGFGYDPIFYDKKFGLSAAEMSIAEKNACSHRGQALATLALELSRS